MTIYSWIYFEYQNLILLIAKFFFYICFMQFSDILGQDYIKNHLIKSALMGRIPHAQLFVGPEWYCMIVTYSLIVVLTIFFLVNAAILLGPAVVAIGTISGLLTVWLFSATACSDPGIIFNYSAPSLNNNNHNNNNNTTFVDNVDEEADIVRTARGINIGGVMEEDDLPPTPRGSRTPNSRAVGASEAYAPAGDGPLRDAAGGLRSSGSSLNTVNIGRLNRKNRSGTTATTRHGIGPNGEQWTMECSICQLYRPPTAVHCYECGVCVDRLDHHCPWTGKCIGKGNLVYFYAFLSTLCLHLGLVVVSTVAYFATGRAAVHTGP